MSPRLQRQTKAQERAAAKYGLATLEQLRRGPRKYHWHLIERDVEALLRRRRDIPTGRDGTVREDVVNYMTCIYLTCCRIEGVPISENLLHLACQQLGVASFARQGAAQKSDQLDDAVRIRETEPTISQKALAKRVGTSARSIRRWEDEGLLTPAGSEDG